MNIIEKIEQDIKVARKALNSETLVSLQTLLGAVQNLPKNKQNDDGVVSKIKSSLDSIDLMLAHLDKSDARVSKLEKEKILLSSYMPPAPILLSREDTDSLIEQNGLSNIKDAMAFFNAGYAGKVDKSYVASKFINKK